MKEQNQLPDLLKKWAENAVKIYHQIASRDDVNIAYYTQSDLSLLTTSPELMIVGINPGSTSSYIDQRRNENWSYLYNNPLDGNHLLKGNYCHEKGKPSSWDNHRKWKYWAGLRRCLSKTYLLNTIDEDNKIIITNASFFSTKKANEISAELLIETIPQTLDLIKISNPKHLLFLSGKSCFERLGSISESTDLVNFEYRHVYGNIYIGNLNGKLCIGIPHPAYKSNEELNLVASVISHLIKVKAYKDIDVELINKECSKQIEVYKERIINHKKVTCSIDINEILQQVISRLKTEILDEKSIVEKQEPKLYRFKLNEDLILTITRNEGGYIAIRGEEINDYLINKYSKMLKDLGFRPYKNVWLGRKYFKDFGNNVVKDVVISIVEAVAKIKNDIDLN